MEGSSETPLSGDDEWCLRRAIQLSREAVALGNHPFGCVIAARRKDANPTAGHAVSPSGDQSQSSAAAAAPSPATHVLIEAMNQVNTVHDPTAHAETTAVRAFGAYLAGVVANSASSPSSLDLKDYEVTLYTSTEPCVMCCGAIYWSFAIDRVVYACREETLGRYAGADFLFPCRQVFARGGQRLVKVEGPFLEDAAAEQHALYWPKLGH